MENQLGNPSFFVMETTQSGSQLNQFNNTEGALMENPDNIQPPHQQMDNGAGESPAVPAQGPQGGTGNLEGAQLGVQTLGAPGPQIVEHPVLPLPAAQVPQQSVAVERAVPEEERSLEEQRAALQRAVDSIKSQGTIMNEEGSLMDVDPQGRKAWNLVSHASLVNIIVQLINA